MDIYSTDSVDIAYRIIRHKGTDDASDTAKNLGVPRRLLLIHGSGVAGLLTWQAIQKELIHWDEVLIPDLRGMGKTYTKPETESPFTMEDTVADMVNLLDHVGWENCDLGGYSYGGLTAMLLKQINPKRFKHLFLIEPAGMDRLSIEATREFRSHYHEVAQRIRDGDTEEAVTEFLDLVSPERSKNVKAEALTIKRLKDRIEGFANALDAVSTKIESFDRQSLINDVGTALTFVGGLSHPEMKAFHQQQTAWTMIEVKGTDHSLPFQKPKAIARHVNDHFSKIYESFD